MNESDFIAWARSALAPLDPFESGPPWEDLAPLGEQLKETRAVALSEAVHGAAEPLKFRNRLLRYLVEKHDFTAVAIESGLTESRLIHEYVRGGSGDLDAVLARGLSWTFDRLPQNRTLIEWLRLYNADPGRTRKISFYGFDVPGSPSNTDVRRGVDTALTEALRYLKDVDKEAADLLNARLECLMPSLSFGLVESTQRLGYEQLTQAERDTLTAAIADLIALLERQEARYIADSIPGDYQWAYRNAIGARQVDAWLRQIPLGWQPLSEEPAHVSDSLHFLSSANDVRDRAQADNLEWILDQEGPEGKILIFAARYHLSMVPLKSSVLRDDTEREQVVAGTYLKRRLGRELLTIGNLVGEGEWGCGAHRGRFGRASADSLDGLAGQVGVPRFLLDLRTAPASIKSWLEREHSLLMNDTQVLKLPVTRGFDFLFYIDTVTPACV